MTVKEIYKIIDEFAPFNIAMEHDNPGLLIGHENAEISRVLVTLDADLPALEKAVDEGCQLVFAHHPFIFDGERQVNDTTGQGRKILYAVEHNLAVISAHTNLDSCKGGINDTLGALLNLRADNGFCPTQNGGMLGRLGTHVFENTEAFLRHAAKVLNVRPRYRFVNNKFERVAWVSGSGASCMEDAKAAGADTLITGDCKYSAFMNAAEMDLNLIDLGHFETEQIILPVMAGLLTRHGLTVVQQDIPSPINTLE
ncbi:MAG: Nif3-like dinuclear metal center hexameric protein [Clostridia bacterium]|nr:Nif3-like dinuclear metal center hexameric protein [Clostridia bacterium]